LIRINHFPFPFINCHLLIKIEFKDFNFNNLNKVNNLSFGFISSKSREISDEIAHFSSKGIAEGAISKKKNRQDRGKILDFEQIESKTQVNNYNN
jgi:hypothetical protein